MPTKEQLERLEEANALLRLIGSHGRRFFWCNDDSPDGYYAHFTFNDGRLYYVDEISKKSIYLGRTLFGNNWPFFSHSGRVRALVESIRDYILRGTPVPHNKIATPRDWDNSRAGNIWGYSKEAAAAVRQAATAMPMISVSSF